MPATVLHLFFATVLFLAMNSPSESASHNKKLVNYRENLLQVNRMKCSEPKARLVYLEDEYEMFSDDSIYIPHAAVLHRCDKSVGCCRQPGHECAEVLGEDVTFTFHVISNDGDKRREEIKLRNHLECQCQSSSER